MRLHIEKLMDINILYAIKITNQGLTLSISYQYQLIFKNDVGLLARDEDT